MAIEPKSNASLSEWQAYIDQKIRDRGFGEETVQQKFILLVEEIGELAKALRPLEGIKTSGDSNIHNLEHEAADVFWLLCCICNGTGIDLDNAIRSKEAVNEKRVWR